MKSCLLTIGEGGEKILRSVMTVTASGATNTPPEIRVLSFSPFSSETYSFSHDLEAVGFFPTVFRLETQEIALPDRHTLTEGNDDAELLLYALRGRARGLGSQNDADFSEWSMSFLLENKALAKIEAIIRELGIEDRLLIACDLSDPESAGKAIALCAYLRSSFGENAPSIGFAFLGKSGENAVLERLRSGHLVRETEEQQPVSGADFAYFSIAPEGLGNAGLLCTVMLALFSADFLSGKTTPAPGMHFPFVPSTFDWKVFGNHQNELAAFLEGSVWLLTDLLPAMKLSLEHPNKLRALSPGSRAAIFRRLFYNSNASPDHELVRRTFQQLVMDWVLLVRQMPDALRIREANEAQWSRLVRICGQYVTAASTYDIELEDAEISGLSRLQTVHRDSLEDTAEEKAQKTLEEDRSKQQNLLNQREALFQEAGAVRTRQAITECLNKCQEALDKCKTKRDSMPADSADDRIARDKLDLRIRTLKAAVKRCQNDLNSVCSSPALSALPTPSVSLTRPYAGELLNEQLLPLLGNISAEGNDEKQKLVRDAFRNLIPGRTASEIKNLLRYLADYCFSHTGDPLSVFLHGVFSAVANDFQQNPLPQVHSTMPDLPLLPDLTAGDIYFPFSAFPDRVVVTGSHNQVSQIRGVLALLLLRQYRQPSWRDASLSFTAVRPQDAALTRIWLRTVSASGAWIISLRDEQGKLPLAVILPEKAILPAIIPARRINMIPEFVTWFDPINHCFRDPCPHLGESDRKLLTEQLTRLRVLLTKPDSRPLSDFLQSFHRDIMLSATTRSEQEDSLLPDRLKAVFGLLPLQSYAALSCAVSVYEKDLKEDKVCCCLSGRKSVSAPDSIVTDEKLYLMNGHPFARESALCLLESPLCPDEELMLNSLKPDTERLFLSSDNYRDALRSGLTDLLKRYPNASERSLKIARDLLQTVSDPVEEEITELNYPWDPEDASVQTILAECVGNLTAGSLRDPFTDKMVLIPRQGGFLIGDTVLSLSCKLDPVPVAEGEPSIPADAVLPPLKPGAALAICDSGLLNEKLLSFRRDGDNIAASLLIRGHFDLLMTRSYTPEQILIMYADDIPTIALWPAVPFRAADWNAYFLYTHLSEKWNLSAADGDSLVPLEGETPRFVSRLNSYPRCIFLHFHDEIAAAIPNLLPYPELPEGRDYSACVDFGAAGTSIMLTDGGSTLPLQGSTAVRTLLRHPSASPEHLRQEFLPALPVSSLLPTAVRLFRNELNSSPVPFRDGIIYMPANMRDVLNSSQENIYTSLKYNGEKSRAAELYLHQLMLMAALQARTNGARTLNWRFALPSGMNTEGKTSFTRRLRQLAEAVSEESGISLPAITPPLTFATETTALGAYFRESAPEEIRSSFLLLDLGAEDANLAIFLRGSENAVQEVRIPLGIQYMLMPSLLKDPDLLLHDYGQVPSEDFRRELQGLYHVLLDARKDLTGLRRARLALDTFIADYSPILFHTPEGYPSRTSALYLLYLSFLLSMSGLMLCQVCSDASRNDFIPSQMSLCLAGRGITLMNIPDKSIRFRLQQFPLLFRNDRVSQLFWYVSPNPKMEIPAGLTMTRALSTLMPPEISCSRILPAEPEEILYHFLMLFRSCFPTETNILFPDLFIDDPVNPMTSMGEQLILNAVRDSFQSETDVYASFARSLQTLIEH